MKTKLKDKLVNVQVIVGLLVYSLDRLTTKEAREGDIIEIPQWMVEGLVSESRVTEDFEAPVVVEEESDEEDGDAPLTVAELNELTDVDFAPLETTKDLIAWVEGIELLNELVIHPACKRETSIGKIFDAIEALEA